MFLIRVFNEANESSSACSSELRLPVETSTPPFWSEDETTEPGEMFNFSFAAILRWPGRLANLAG